MGTSRPSRFAAELQRTLDGRNWVESFQELEQLGYSTVFFPDHFHDGPGPLAATAAAAVATTTLNVGILVLDCDYRHPVVLARELATIDHLSSGRLEVGLGAGWKASDYRQAGIPMDRPGIRVDRMIEHTAILKGLWGERPFSFQGAHYQIDDCDGTPKPFTPGGPKILIGGGAPRVLRFAGQTADIVGVNASIHSGEIDTAAAQDGLASAIDHKIDWVRAGAGDRFDEIELNAWLAVASVTDDAYGFAAAVAVGFDSTPEQVLESPLTLIGSPSEIGDRLEERRQRWGYSYHVIPGDNVAEFTPIVAALTGR